MRRGTAHHSLLATGTAMLMLSASTAFSEPSGADLSARCANLQALDQGQSVNPFVAVSVAQCFSFIEGLTTGLQLGVLLTDAGRSFCPPEELSSAQAVLIVQQFLADYPELTGEDAGILAADALMTRYPCFAAAGGAELGGYELLRRGGSDETAGEP